MGNAPPTAFRSVFRQPDRPSWLRPHHPTLARDAMGRAHLTAFPSFFRQPAHPPPPAATSLQNLPIDVQHLILSRIPCLADRGRMSQVCRAWRTMMAQLLHPEDLPHATMVGLLQKRSEEFELDAEFIEWLVKPESDYYLRKAMDRLLNLRPRPLPWLLLPPPHREGSTRVACVLSGCRDHHSITITPTGARVFGSHNGTWLLLHCRDNSPRGNLALDVRNDRVVDLPYILHRDATRIYNVVVLAAALSAWPDHYSCVGAAIGVVPPQDDRAEDPMPVRRPCVALWRKGSEFAYLQALPEANDVELDVEDLIYQDGVFMILTHGNHIRVCQPLPKDQDDGLSVRATWTTRRFQFQDNIDGQLVRARYLIKSRRELLLVLRFTPGPNQKASMFKVFRETDASVWSELRALDGRMLFLGHGCSRSYETKYYPGFKDGIYFKDDGDFYDASVMFGNGNGNARQYPCSHNGVWSEGNVDLCFPSSDPSDYSTPVWLLP